MPKNRILKGGLGYSEMTQDEQKLLKLDDLEKSAIMAAARHSDLKNALPYIQDAHTKFEHCTNSSQFSHRQRVPKYKPQYIRQTSTFRNIAGQSRRPKSLPALADWYVHDLLCIPPRDSGDVRQIARVKRISEQSIQFKPQVGRADRLKKKLSSHFQDADIMKSVWVEIQDYAEEQVRMSLYPVANRKGKRPRIDTPSRTPNPPGAVEDTAREEPKEVSPSHVQSKKARQDPGSGVNNKFSQDYQKQNKNAKSVAAQIEIFQKVEDEARELLLYNSTLASESRRFLTRCGRIMACYRSHDSDLEKFKDFLKGKNLLNKKGKISGPKSS